MRRAPLLIGAAATLLAADILLLLAAARNRAGEPEAVIDASRYFVQAKYLELFGPSAFFRDWGGALPESFLTYATPDIQAAADATRQNVPVFDPTVAFIERLGLRGEVCRATVARLWPWPQPSSLRPWSWRRP